MKPKTLTPTFLAFLLFPALSFAGSAAVSGTVTFEGDVPVLQVLKMSADPKCEAKHAGPVQAEMLVLGADKTVANVFVKVKSGLPADAAHATPTEPVVINQVGCLYVPHVLAAMKDQPVKILNSDGTLHNVHGLPVKNKEFNVAMPGFKKEITHQFDQVEEVPFKVKCDVHPWMSGYVTVMSHPYFSVTSQDGKFEVKGLNAGDYEIEIWHEKLGTQTAQVTVADGETKTVNFTLKKPDTVSRLDAIMIVQ